jgi:hypothetical protein
MPPEPAPRPPASGPVTQSTPWPPPLGRACSAWGWRRAICRRSGGSSSHGRTGPRSLAAAGQATAVGGRGAQRRGGVQASVKQGGGLSKPRRASWVCPAAAVVTDLGLASLTAGLKCRGATPECFAGPSCGGFNSPKPCRVPLRPPRRAGATDRATLSVQASARRPLSTTIGGGGGDPPRSARS